MGSYFAQVKAQRLAEQQAKKQAQTTGDMKGSTVYEQKLIQLNHHQRELSAIQSVEKKIELKQKLLPEYQSYIDGVLEANAGAQDDIITTLMVWHIDTSNIPTALKIAEYVLAHKLVMPERFNRQPATLIAEQIAEIFIKNPHIEHSRDSVEHVMQITAEHDMPDQVRAKLEKAAGFIYEETDTKKAISHLERALKLDDKAGVKKRLENLYKTEQANHTSSNHSPHHKEKSEEDVSKEEAMVSQNSAVKQEASSFDMSNTHNTDYPPTSGREE